MSSPIIWIVIPGIFAVVLYILQRWQRAVILSGCVLSLILSWLAWRAPIGGLILLGPWSFRISDTLTILGRRFILGDADRTILVFIYLGATCWFAGSLAARPGKLFVPIGLGIVALMTAALAVEPFLYAALLIEISALLAIPILTAPHGRNRRGILRFLTFQTLGTPFLLFTGWLSSEIDANPNNPTLILQAVVLLGMGFSFLLAVFPFHTWVPMLSEESHPYPAAFVFFFLPGIVSIFGIGFMERYAWLRENPKVFAVLLSAGALIAATGGIWAAFQRHLGRQLGYAVLVDIGLSLMVIGASQGSPSTSYSFREMANSPWLRIFFSFLFTRGISLGLWALALSAIRLKTGDLSFRSVQGMGRQMPVATTGLILAHFSLAGFPLLAGFPVRLALWEQLAHIAPWIGFWALIGSAGLLAGSLRSLAVLVMGPQDQPWKVSESRYYTAFLLIGIVLLIWLGLFPRLL